MMGREGSSQETEEGWLCVYLREQSALSRDSKCKGPELECIQQHGEWGKMR